MPVSKSASLAMSRTLRIPFFQLSCPVRLQERTVPGGSPNQKDTILRRSVPCGCGTRASASVRLVYASMVAVPEAPPDIATQEHQQQGADHDSRAYDTQRRQVPGGRQDAVLECPHKLEDGTGQEAREQEAKDREDYAQEDTPTDRRRAVASAVEAHEPPGDVAPEEESEEEYKPDDHETRDDGGVELPALEI